MKLQCRFTTRVLAINVLFKHVFACWTQILYCYMHTLALNLACLDWNSDIDSDLL